MCLREESYKDCMTAEEYLRRIGMNREMPGFEYLKLAAVLSKEKNITDEATLVDEVKKQASLVVGKREVIKDWGPIEQAMIEAIRSISPTDVKMTIMDFIDQVLASM